MFKIKHAAEKLLHFIRAEDDWQFLWLPGKREDLFRHPIPFECQIEEKAHRRKGDVDRARRQLLLVGQIDLIGPAVLATEQVGRLAEVSCKQRYLLQIRVLGIERKIAHLHVFAHALAKWGHDELLCPMEWAATSRPILAQLGLLLNT
ncbi:hypothetical protein J2Z31_005998 [Sinorhizobium kostiense]|uniref:Uncharacterized protein n=1 Tax=Sinorhizobium kostiense TaxID=76747 RepID=A0ABS4RAT9_9HYPH|nr:hypothetical protein [Sinorhizobium kostiense]